MISIRLFYFTQETLVRLFGEVGECRARHPVRFQQLSAPSDEAESSIYWPLDKGLLRPALVDVALVFGQKEASKRLLENFRRVMVPGGLLLLTGMEFRAPTDPESYRLWTPPTDPDSDTHRLGHPQTRTRTPTDPATHTL
jgi:hypothetical protein